MPEQTAAAQATPGATNLPSVVVIGSGSATQPAPAGSPAAPALPRRVASSCLNSFSRVTAPFFSLYRWTVDPVTVPASTGTVTCAKTIAVVEKPSRVVSPCAAGPNAGLRSTFVPLFFRSRSRGSGAIPEPESMGAVGIGTPAMETAPGVISKVENEASSAAGKTPFTAA